MWLFEVRGKNTAGGEPKVRDAWMPEAVADDIHKYSRAQGLAASEPWVSASTSTVQRWVREARQQLLEETDDWRWERRDVLVSALGVSGVWAVWGSNVVLASVGAYVAVAHVVSAGSYPRALLVSRFWT